ncbi:MULTISPECIES: ACP phosphodiesterase [Hydrocarboniphaga]|jgi:acyl carrier protein phosphodiesterase|uniref:Acyl carrier protein phosphodiesterase n=1 Tax=Hydrocarboniphaga effusa AP103 TaxID=1172194 RepID=I8T766_9GAMM|nr:MULTISPECIES: ACP phosphodiesterase [Hydrocarboniphaga]EIT69563.1 hypothetical protein WQQ_31450 [Hydrocarboniphaga effusa AP103]MDZ4080124.1 ACP phosphodiesterase [Hydrocarboniphaga sp.]
MNYLVHLLIADRVGADLAGAVLGDFVRGSDLARFPQPIADSIRLHRRIDALTDHHPLRLAAVGRFIAGPRRYAPVILDVLSDHALAIEWARYSADDFTHFCERCAIAVADASDWFEGPRKPDRPGFTALLQSYAEPAGIDLALRRIAHRLKRAQPMRDASAGWRAHLPALSAELPELLGDLIAAASRFQTQAAGR